MPNGGPNFGGTIRPLYTVRSQVMYVIPETELSQISHLNTLAIVFFSAGTALLSFAIGIWVDASFQTPPLPATAEVLKSVLSPILCILGLLLYTCGGWQLWARRSMLNTIRDESKEISNDDNEPDPDKKLFWGR